MNILALDRTGSPGDIVPVRFIQFLPKIVIIHIGFGAEDL